MTEQETVAGLRAMEASTPDRPTRTYGGDLFTGDCSKGQHAWRVCFDEPGTPVKCKWCDEPRYPHKRGSA